MGKLTINMRNEFFEVEGKEGDLLYSFVGNCGGMKSDHVLYGKTINLNEVYERQLEDVRKFLFDGEFLNRDGYYKDNSERGIMNLVNWYIHKVYGISIESVYNKMRGNKSGATMTRDMLFGELKVRYGFDKLDWLYLYDNMNLFNTNDGEILEYIGNRLMDNEFYKYFVKEYKLRTVGVVKRVNNSKTGRHGTFIKIEYGNGSSKDIQLTDIVKNHRQWWVSMTGCKRTNRGDIKDYDKLINNREVREVFPEYCPVYSNLRLNYTGIDFCEGNKNIKRCSEVAGYSNRGETWSFASIDRIDSNKGYSYDNIRIISQYANQLKSCGDREQLRRLLQYMDEQSRCF
jgi:hypothetical protein